jgi:hypothetical protein
MLNQTLNPDATCVSDTHVPGPHPLHGLPTVIAHLTAPRPGDDPAPTSPSRRRLAGPELAARLANPLAR